MARNKKILPVLESVNMFDTSTEGVAVGKHGDMIVFVKGAVPGDVVDVQLTKKKKAFAEGRMIELVKSSPYRIDPECQHFGKCGGCKWQHMDYSKQLEFKRKHVQDAFERIGKLTIHVPEVIGANPQYYYRNKLEYTFSSRRWLEREDMHLLDENPSPEAIYGLGFHIPKLFDKVLDVQKCYLQDDLTNAIRLEVKNFALKNGMTFFDLRKQTGNLRNLIVRNTTIGEWMVIVVFHIDDDKNKLLLEHLKNRFSELTSLMYVINPKKNDTITDLDVNLFSGRDHIIEKLGDLSFIISPKSFFQTNSKQAKVLYDIAKDFATPKPDDLVYDFYTGTGTIANYIADSVRRVVGIEYVEDAIEDARKNASLNNIDNTSFFAGDMKDVLNDDFISKNGKPSLVITDPPRAGMHADVVDRINKLKADRVVYVSCNPSTQARDIQLLMESYRLDKVQPVDMFPHTHHIENVALLSLK